MLFFNHAMIISSVSGLIKGENSPRAAKAALGLLHVSLYPVHYIQMSENQPDSWPRTDSDHELGFHRCRDVGLLCLQKGGQKGVGFSTGKFEGLIQL